MRLNSSIFFVIPVLCCLAAPVFALDLGRVFLSPSERAELNLQREQYYQPVEIEPVEVIPFEAIPEPEIAADESSAQPLLVNGYVKRHGTSGTVWINGESTYDGDMANMNVDHLKTRIIGQQVLVTPINEKQSVYLKPGQGFNPNSQEISDGYEFPSASSAATSTP